MYEKKLLRLFRIRSRTRHVRISESVVRFVIIKCPCFVLFLIFRIGRCWSYVFSARCIIFCRTDVKLIVEISAIVVRIHANRLKKSRIGVVPVRRPWKICSNSVWNSIRIRKKKKILYNTGLSIPVISTVEYDWSGGWEGSGGKFHW